MHGTFHLRSDIDRLYMSKRKGRRGFINCQDCTEAEETNLDTNCDNCVKKFKEDKNTQKEMARAQRQIRNINDYGYGRMT